MFGNDELSPLIEKEAANNWLTIVLGVFLAVATFLSIKSFLDIVHIMNDHSIPLVVCPKTYDLDSPVLMKTIEAASVEAKDKWVKGFIRRFTVAEFPRTPADAAPGLKYVVNHSKGEVRGKYQSYLDHLEDFQSLISQKFYYSFYPDNSLNIRIRATNNIGEWAVEIDGFLIRTAGHLEQRSTPTLTYLVHVGPHTMRNPEGLYVTDSNILQIADYVSGRKEQK